MLAPFGLLHILLVGVWELAPGAKAEPELVEAVHIRVLRVVVPQLRHRLRQAPPALPPERRPEDLPRMWSLTSQSTIRAQRAASAGRA